MPLFADGKVIGVLHVGSLSGRPFGQGDVVLLQLAADRAALALQSMMSQDDAMAAMALHPSLLPGILPDVPRTGLVARYVAGSGNVGGDWYDVFLLPGGKLGVAVGDVAGSGLSAAVIMGRMCSTLRAYVLQAAALRMLDCQIQYFEPGAMATVLYGLYTLGIGEFAFSSAGHLPPVLAARGSRPAYSPCTRTRPLAPPTTRSAAPRPPTYRPAPCCAATPTAWWSAATRPSTPASAGSQRPWTSCSPAPAAAGPCSWQKTRALRSCAPSWETPPHGATSLAYPPPAAGDVKKRLSRRANPLPRDRETSGRGNGNGLVAERSPESAGSSGGPAGPVLQRDAGHV